MSDEEVALQDPPSLRERQRRLGQDVILDAAFALFEKKGYPKTTMQMIADRAGVGVATVFRHFGSKAGVVAALLRRDVEVIFARGRAMCVHPGDDPVQAMVDLLLIMLEAWSTPAVRLRGFSRLWLALPTGHADTDAAVKWADAELRGLIRRLLEHYQALGRVSRALDPGEITAVVFAVFNQHFIWLATGEEPTLQRVREELRRRIPLLFAGWLTSVPLRSAQGERRVAGRGRGKAAR